jgi:hypothetical protein
VVVRDELAVLILTRHAQQNVARDHLDLAWTEATITRPQYATATPEMRPLRARGGVFPSGADVCCGLCSDRPLLISWW